MTLGRVLRDESGSIAMMSGLLMTLLVPAIIMAVDLTNVAAVKDKVQSRLDSAVISASQFDDLSEASDDGEMQERGTAFVMNSLKGSNVNVKNPTTTFTYDENTNVVRAFIEFDAPTLFIGKIITMDRIQVVSELTPPESIEIEVALSLDVSASMGWQIASDAPAEPGSRRINALREGLDGLISVFEENPLVNARVSVVPYSSSVNITATSEGAVNDDDASQNVWATERVERNGAGKLKVSKESPKRGQKVEKNQDAVSPQASVLPLSELNEVVTHVASIQPDGGTAGHIGAEWALYSLLPDWQDVWQHPDRAPAELNSEARKVMVIMTDGDFTVTQTPDLTIDDAYEIFQDVCETARDSGIAVYTVGLKSSARTDEELTECSGDPTKYFPVASRTAIVDAFEQIGEDATKLRISK